MRSAWTSLALFALALTALAHPPHGRNKDDEVVYDQRQNGTENYRLHIDGVVVALAPAEVLFNLAGLMDGFLPDGGGGEGDEIPEDDLYPPPKPDEEMALTTQAAEASSSSSTTEAPASSSTAAAVAAEEEEIPNRDTTENAEKPATSETAQAQKPNKKLKGKIFLSRWLLPLMRRLL